MHADIKNEGINLSGTVDFVITWDESSKEFVVDFFDKCNLDNDSAYLESFSDADYERILHDAHHYILI